MANLESTTKDKLQISKLEEDMGDCGKKLV
jgi:hypothetical protein